MELPNQPPPTDLPPLELSANVNPARRRVILVELLVVLCLGFAPQLSYALLNIGGGWGDSFPAEMFGYIVWSLQVVAPVLYIIWRSDNAWADFGICKPQWIVDLVLSVTLLGAAWILCNWLANLFAPPYDPAAGEAIPATDFPRPSGVAQYLLLVVAMLCNSITEELVMRAYLITRLRELGTHATMAITIAAVMFASYHVYQGVWVLIPHTALGILFGASFVLTRRIWPLVIAHTTYNLLLYAAY